MQNGTLIKCPAIKGCSESQTASAPETVPAFLPPSLWVQPLPLLCCRGQLGGCERFSAALPAPDPARGWEELERHPFEKRLVDNDKMSLAVAINHLRTVLLVNFPLFFVFFSIARWVQG